MKIGNDGSSCDPAPCGTKPEAIPHFPKHSAKYHMVPQCVPHNFGIVAKMEILHNPVLMKCHGTGGQI